MAEDGQNVNLDGLTVEAAAQLEEVIGLDDRGQTSRGSTAEPSAEGVKFQRIGPACHFGSGRRRPSDNNPHSTWTTNNIVSRRRTGE